MEWNKIYVSGYFYSNLPMSSLFW